MCWFVLSNVLLHVVVIVCAVVYVSTTCTVVSKCILNHPITVLFVDNEFVSK